MHYKIKHLGKIIKIKSENAALTHKLQSSALVNLLSNHARVQASLDYGCGKLRYTRDLRRFSDRVIIVDSKEQLDRKQMILDRRISIRDYVQRYWNDVNTLDTQEFEKEKAKFDFILCSNVLSAIPSKKEVKKVLNRLKRSLAPGGKCLLVNQHTNSYFTKWRKEGTRYGYGWIFHGYRGHSYYGIINKALLQQLLPKIGFTDILIWIEGQSTFALCG